MPLTSVQKENSEKSIQNPLLKVDNFMKTKTVDLSKKQAELDLLQNKIKEVKMQKAFSTAVKTPSFSNLEL